MVQRIGCRSFLNLLLFAIHRSLKSKIDTTSFEWKIWVLVNLSELVTFVLLQKLLLAGIKLSFPWADAVNLLSGTFRRWFLVTVYVNEKGRNEWEHVSTSATGKHFQKCCACWTIKKNPVKYIHTSRFSPI